MEGKIWDRPSAFDLNILMMSLLCLMGNLPSEFTLKLLSSAEKIGGMIGKGGLNAKQLQQETGACIHVENMLTELYGINNHKLSMPFFSCKLKLVNILRREPIRLRLLVLSNKVGCILGQGGHAINEMRRRIHADIHVFSKEDKLKCASGDEELVQISGSFGIDKDALAEIASRLRTRCLRDANTRGKPVPVMPLPGFGHVRNTLHLVLSEPEPLDNMII